MLGGCSTRLSRIEKLLTRRCNLEERIEQAELNLSEKEKEVKRLDRQLNLERREYQLVRADIGRLQNRLEAYSLMAALPRNLLEVLEKVERLNEGRILFTSEARQTAREYRGTVDVRDSWECLWAIATLLHELYFDEQKRAADVERAFKDRTGFEFALHEGKQTHKDSKLMKLRATEYKGRVLHTEPHVKIGTKDPKILRVYLAADQVDRIIVVDHCGWHRDISLGKK